MYIPVYVLIRLLHLAVPAALVSFDDQIFDKMFHVFMLLPVKLAIVSSNLSTLSLACDLTLLIAIINSWINHQLLKPEMER